MKSSPSLKWNWPLRNSCSQRKLSKHRYTFEQINKSNSIWVRFAPLLIFLFSIYQAVNKLAEIMNRKEVRGGGSRRGNDTDVRRKEKENRKLQLELRSEREKLNSTIIKYQREINDMQAVWPLFSVWRMPGRQPEYSFLTLLLFPAAIGGRVSGACGAADGSRQ